MPRVAILGAGYACRYYINALPALGYSIVGISGRTKEKGIAAALEAKTDYFETFEQLLEEFDADILCITTPTPNHLEAISKAARSGINKIFCEKPLAMNCSEAMKIQTICQKHAVILATGFKMRFESIFTEVKKAIGRGEIGDLVTVSMNFFQPIPHSSWFLDSGFIRETLSHPLDLANWFVGASPDRVICTTGNVLGGKEEDRAFAMLSYPSGIIATINGGWIQDYPHLPGRHNICFEIVGTKGYLCGVRPDILLLCSASGQEKMKIMNVNPIELEFQDFVEKVSQDKTPSTDLRVAMNAQRVIDAARESALSGKPVILD